MKKSIFDIDILINYMYGNLSEKEDEEIEIFLDNHEELTDIVNELFEFIFLHDLSQVDFRAILLETLKLKKFNRINLTIDPFDNYSILNKNNKPKENRTMTNEI